jgi:RNA polymerase primary sigma factor
MDTEGMAYQTQIRAWSLLSVDEERRLGALSQQGDLAARNRLVEANLRLVVSVARGYLGQGDLTLDDLIQEGNIGLMQAAVKFDPALGYRFSTYATWWIRQAVSRARLNKGNAIHIPVYLTEQARKARKGEDPSFALDAIPAQPISLDRALSEDDERTLADVIAAPEVALEAVPIASERAKAIQQALRILSPREREVLRLRYGLDPRCQGEGWSLAQVAEAIGVTRERIRQIETGALTKLRKPVVARKLREVAS